MHIPSKKRGGGRLRGARRRGWREYKVRRQGEIRVYRNFEDGTINQVINGGDTKMFIKKVLVGGWEAKMKGLVKG